jgi:hypothetical protein
VFSCHNVFCVFLVRLKGSVEKTIEKVFSKWGKACHESLSLSCFLVKDCNLASLSKLKDLLTGCVSMQLARMTANLATGFRQNGLLFGKDGNPARDGNVYILNG